MELDGITRVYTVNKDPADPRVREVFPDPSAAYDEGVQTGDAARQVMLSCDALGVSNTTGRWGADGRPDFSNPSVTWDVHPYDGAGSPSGDAFEVEGVSGRRFGKDNDYFGRLAHETEKYLGKTGLTILVP